MKKNDYFKHLRIPIFMGILLSLLTISEVSATHFRYGHITWEELGENPSGGFDVQFTIQTAWRRDYDQFPANVQVGQTFNDPGVEFEFGDGDFTVPIYTATSINIQENWVAGTAVIIHTYNAPGNYIAYMESCCRLDAIENANGGAFGADFRVATLVNVGTGNRPPISNLPAIINLPVNQNPASFFVTAFDEDNDDIRFRLAVEDEVLGVGSFDNYVAPSGLSIDPLSGLVTWSTVGTSIGDLFMLSLIIEDLDDNGDPKSFTQLDFLIRIVGQSVPPIFIAPTPPNQALFTAIPGDVISFTVQATDADGLGNVGGNIILNAVGTPTGALTSYNPSLPAGPDNPISTTFTWTPTLSDLGTYAINFTATDDLGVQALTVVNISVGFNPIFNVPPTPGNGSIICATAGDNFSQTIEAADLDTTDLVNLTVALTPLPATMPTPPFTPGGGFPAPNTLPTSITYSPPLPLAPGNPVSTTFSGTVAASDWGVYAFEYTSTDTDNDQTTLINYLIIDQDPEFTTPQPSSPLTVIVNEPFSLTISATDPDIPFGDAVAFADPSESYVSVPTWLSFNDDGNGNLTLSGTPTVADIGLHNLMIELHDRTTHFLHTHCSWQFQNFDIYVTPINLEVVPGPPVIVVGVEYCFTAIVSDDNGNPLEGIAVNVTGTGANSYNLTGVTDANGEVEFCYVGTNPGMDISVVTAGDQMEEITVTWVEPGAQDGCTDASACNFDPTATAYDGTCTYSLCYTDCDGNITNPDLVPGTSCDDGDPATMIDVIDQDCNCNGIINPNGGCTDPNACNYDDTANTDDGTCIDCDTPSSTSTQACDDGDPCTMNDEETILICNGFVCVPCAGTSDADCTSGETTTQACDDGDPCTMNDEETTLNCDGSICIPCVGIPIVDCSLGQTTTQACDDGNPCTANDEETILDCDGSLCVPCAGTPLDCSLGETTTQACDDGDSCTINDEETIITCDGFVCIPCSGISIDCSSTETTTQACDDGDPCTINDEETVLACDGSVCVPCTGTPADCSSTETTTQACTDGNPCTINDQETILTCDGSVCVPCAGIALDCSSVQTTVQVCDDGNPNTANDVETILNCDGSICVPCEGVEVIPTCIITATNVETICNDNGTAESSDDTFTFTVFPVGNNTGTTYSISGDVSQSNVPYDTPSAVFGPYPANTFVHITITDDSDPSCSITRSVTSSCIGVPTLSQWGLIILALILLNLGVLYIRQTEMKPVKQAA